MGVQHIFGTAGATGGGWSAQPGTLQPAYAESLHEPRWQIQCRAPKVKSDPNCWRSRWSFGCRAGGGAILEYAPIGGAVADRDWYEPTSVAESGTQSIKFILGQCVDGSGNPAAGAVVQAFRTSDDAFAGEVNSTATDGQFIVPTPFVGANHYLVAYKPGSPDIGGTTVNTLVPTNIDGT
jgi:hypothetical protein